PHLEGVGPDVVCVVPVEVRGVGAGVERRLDVAGRVVDLEDAPVRTQRSRRRIDGRGGAVAVVVEPRGAEHLGVAVERVLIGGNSGHTVGSEVGVGGRLHVIVVGDREVVEAAGGGL